MENEYELFNADLPAAEVLHTAQTVLTILFAARLAGLNWETTVKTLQRDILRAKADIAADCSFEGTIEELMFQAVVADAVVIDR